MTKIVQQKGGSTALNDAYTGAVREITIDTDKNTIRVHDGTTLGGFEVARIDTVAGLQAELNAKAPTVHTHSLIDITQSGATTGQFAAWDGVEWAPVDHPVPTSAEVLPLVGDVTNDISGFPNRTDTSLSFDTGTRTVTLSANNANAKLYWRGNEIPITDPLTLQWSDTDGGRYIIWNPDTEELSEYGPTPDIRSGQILVSYVYWNVANQKLVIQGDERHGSYRDTQWHYTQHRDVGAVWRSGGAIEYTLNDDTAVSINIGTPLLFADEDLEHVITHSATPSAPYEQILSPAARIPVAVLEGTVYNEYPPTSDVPWLMGSARASYNPVSLGSGSLVDVTSGKYINYWMLSTNDQEYPIKLLLGRELHDDVDSSGNEIVEQFGIPFAEMAVLYRIVLHVDDTYTGNTPRVQIAAVYKAARDISAGTATISASSHDALTNRGLPDQHPITAITNLQTALDAKANTVHTHSLSDITQSGASTGQVPTWNGSAWVPGGGSIQTLNIYHGDIATATTNATIPYDNTVPLVSEGYQMWTRSITPSSLTSVFVIQQHIFAANGSNSVYITSVLFAGSTCLAAIASGLRQSTFPMPISQLTLLEGPRANLNTIVFTGRIGASSNSTTYINQGNGGKSFGGAGTGQYLIYEIEP